MHSRRQFLKLTGVILVSSQMNLRFPQAQAAEETIYGRALSAVPVYPNPSTYAPVIDRLWPDSVTPILDSQVGWYKVPGGYVHRTGLQPIASYPASTISAANHPFWAQVSAPVAPVYDHCAVDAPLMTRVGNGGVAFVADYLPDSQGGWYAIADDAGTTLGWSQAIYWQPITTGLQYGAAHQLEVDLNAQRLTAWGDGEIVLEVPCSTDPSVVPGRYEFQAQKLGGVRLVTGETSKPFHAVPWTTDFAHNLTLGGVYWHNRFGEPVPGMGIQVTPLIAQWLYNWVGEDSRITLV